MLSQMQQLQHQVSALAGGRPADSRSRGDRDRLPDSSFKPGEIAELMREGRCFRCKQKGHMKNDCPQKSKK